MRTPTASRMVQARWYHAIVPQRFQRPHARSRITVRFMVLLPVHRYHSHRDRATHTQSILNKQHGASAGDARAE